MLMVVNSNNVAEHSVLRKLAAENHGVYIDLSSASMHEAQKLISDFGGEVPSETSQLETLPGVGRKTANVIASVIYDKPVIAVDTHVFRVSRRLGLSDGSTVEAVEKDLTAGFEEHLRGKAHHWLILHGRYVCTARKPKCQECGIRDYCMTYVSENVIV